MNLQQQHPVMLPNRNNENGGQNFKIQNQVTNRINHYQGMQCVQNLQVQCEFNNGYSKFRMPQPARNYTFHAPPVSPMLTSFPAVSEHINPRTTMVSTNNESPAMLQNFQIQNQVANCINHYQALNRHVQNSSNQFEFGMPQPVQNESVLLDEGFHAPTRLTGFPAVPEHINPHTTMMTTNSAQWNSVMLIHRNYFQRLTTWTSS